jgi:hypothetical protein
MATKNICLIPLDWSLEDYDSHSCLDGSHVHLSHAEVTRHEKRNIVHWLREGKSRRERSVVQIQELPERDTRWAGRASSQIVAGHAMNGGLSFQLGEYLAAQWRLRESWAQVMVSQIKHRPLEPDPV